LAVFQKLNCSLSPSIVRAQRGVHVEAAVFRDGGLYSSGSAAVHIERYAAAFILAVSGSTRTMLVGARLARALND